MSAWNSFFLYPTLLLLLSSCFGGDHVPYQEQVNTCVNLASKKAKRRLTKQEVDLCHARVIPVVEDSNLDGGLNQAEVIQAMKPALKEIRICYEKELAKDPEIKGKLYFKWWIDAQGKTTQLQWVKAKSDLENTALKDCAMEKIGAVGYPKPRNGKKTLAEYPIGFSPAGVGGGKV